MGFIPQMQGWLTICKSVNMIHHINKMKDKNYMIISRDAEKAFDKIQYPLMTKTLNKVGIEGMYLNIIRPYIKSSQLTSYSMVKAESFSSKIRNKTRMPTFATFVQHSTGSPSQSNEARKINKRHIKQKERNKPDSICI